MYYNIIFSGKLHVCVYYLIIAFIIILFNSVRFHLFNLPMLLFLLLHHPLMVQLVGINLVLLDLLTEEVVSQWYLLIIMVGVVSFINSYHTIFLQTLMDTTPENCLTVS